ncbi:hypothetical protein [Azospirillum sp. B4]|uniref:hypothetical protein n=1 Tax=Azospirillum sp. B4 TaxID=95605 RepID=UPI0011DDFDE7|nr:hypothetical protein [Azospirillum sp. B4]
MDFHSKWGSNAASDGQVGGASVQGRAFGGGGYATDLEGLFGPIGDELPGSGGVEAMVSSKDSNKKIPSAPYDSLEGQAARLRKLLKSGERDKAKGRLEEYERQERMLQHMLSGFYRVDKDLPFYVPDQHLPVGQEILALQRKDLAELSPKDLADLTSVTREMLLTERRGQETWVELQKGLEVLRDEAKRRRTFPGLPRGPVPSAERTAREGLADACRGLFAAHNKVALALIRIAKTEDLETAISRLVSEPERLGKVHGDNRGPTRLSRDWQKCVDEIISALKNYLSVIQR